MTAVAPRLITVSSPAPRDPRAAEAAHAEPPRWWWLKRITLGCLLLAAGLAALRAWWGNEAERRFRRAMEPVLIRGEPTVAAEWNPRAVPELLNGAAYLRQAMVATSRTAMSPANTSVNYTAAYTPDAPNWKPVAAQAVAANGAVFPLARQARAFSEFDWGTRARQPMMATLLPHLNDVRSLANTLGDAALYAHETGDDAAALETIRDVRHAAKATRSEGLIVNALVAIGIDEVANIRLQEMAPGLRMAPEESPAPAAAPDASALATGPYPGASPTVPPRGVSRGHVRALVEELLDDRDASEGLRRALGGQRVTNLDAAAWFGGRSRVVRPMFQLDAVRMLQVPEVLVAASRETDLPAALAVMARSSITPTRPAGKNMLWPAPAAAGTRARREPVDFTRLLSNEMLSYAPARIIVQHHRAANERRMTAVSLAAQVYRADHGAWPPSIEALVPKYLPEVPADALAPAGSTLRYRLVPRGLPDGRDRPVVYSAGDNGVYDTTDATVLPGAPQYGWNRTIDEWRDLSRWTPATPATGPSTGPSTAPATSPAPAADPPP